MLRSTGNSDASRGPKHCVFRIDTIIVLHTYTTSAAFTSWAHGYFGFAVQRRHCCTSVLSLLCSSFTMWNHCSNISETASLPGLVPPRGPSTRSSESKWSTSFRKAMLNERSTSAWWSNARSLFGCRLLGRPCSSVSAYRPCLLRMARHASCSEAANAW